MEQILQRGIHLQRVAVENAVDAELHPPFRGRHFFLCLQPHILVREATCEQSQCLHFLDTQGQEHCWTENFHLPNDKMSAMSNLVDL